MQKMIESNEVDVHRIKNNLDRHQNAYDISAGEDAKDADRKEDGSDNQIVREPDGAKGGGAAADHEIFVSFLENKTAPTKAASKTKETTSKGRIISPSKSLPIG